MKEGVPVTGYLSGFRIRRYYWKKAVFHGCGGDAP
jgi:hypothetical protein